MDQAQNGEVVMGMIGPQPDPNIGAVQDAEMEEDEARSEATFRFSVPNFSKLKVRRICNVYFIVPHRCFHYFGGVYF